jgi:hypothetical protein
MPFLTDFAKSAFLSADALLTTYLDPTVPEVDDDAAPITGTLAAEVDATISKTKAKKAASADKKADLAKSVKNGIYSEVSRQKPGEGHGGGDTAE